MIASPRTQHGARRIVILGAGSAFSLLPPGLAQSDPGTATASGSFVKTGAGTLILGGTLNLSGGRVFNPFTGGNTGVLNFYGSGTNTVDVSGGTLSLGGGGSTGTGTLDATGGGTIIINGGGGIVTGSGGNVGTVDLTGSGTGTINVNPGGTLTGTGGTTNVGPGTIDLSGGGTLTILSASGGGVTSGVIDLASPQTLTIAGNLTPSAFGSGNVVVPEPGTGLLAIAGLAALGVRRQRRARSAISHGA